MFDTRIEIMAYSQERDDYNERTMELVPIGTFYAQKTESGGRENLYASRIVHENEVVFTIRYSDKIKSGMFVRLDGRDMKITSVHEEGRRKYLHLKTIKSDAENQS
ncbi:phage head closure protein [Parabacteroides provencensis]|uniref:phage head closure protein n=1 Tax=Parabacteroides provencensis TaxID=1944636 RepID=UPI000C14CD5C|nr:phage head closure protein [Parabacteroides provencensis]